MSKITYHKRELRMHLEVVLTPWELVFRFLFTSTSLLLLLSTCQATVDLALTSKIQYAYSAVQWWIIKYLSPTTFQYKMRISKSERRENKWDTTEEEGCVVFQVYLTLSSWQPAAVHTEPTPLCSYRTSHSTHFWVKYLLPHNCLPCSTVTSPGWRTSVGG